MLKHNITHRNKKNIAIVKVCFQSHVNVRKCYLPYVFLLNCCYFLTLLENILEKFVEDIAGQKVNLKPIFTSHF